MTQVEMLIIEDEALLGSELAANFREKGLRVTLARSLDEARQALEHLEGVPLVVLADLSLPDGQSLDLFEEQATVAGSFASGWVFLTGRGGVRDSVRALRLGATDFLEKPCDLDRLDVVVNATRRSVEAQQRLLDVARRNQLRYPPSSFLGSSSAALQLRTTLEQLCSSAIGSVILQGETGVGKGLVARILHHSGQRETGPFEEVNCAALPKDLVESELFGHEAGAFTGAKRQHRGLLERASGGTLFLDEVSELPLDAQVKFLKAVEEQKVRRVGGERELAVDVRLLSASNRNLNEMIEAGLFREDLYWRLNLFQVEIPPLRSRLEDLEQLVPAFVAEFDARAARDVPTRIPASVWQVLREHDWPGNVRELRNVLERCVLLSTDSQLALRWLQLQAPPKQEAEFDGERLHLPLDGSMALDEMDRFIIATALQRHQGNVTATARALGTTRETLRYRVQKYGLDQ